MCGDDQAVLHEVYERVISATAGSQGPADVLGHLVLAHHMLFLFISTGVSTNFLFSFLITSD